MQETVPTPHAPRDAVQPSLWDRLVNDLPGVAAEIVDLRAALTDALGADRLAGLLAGGARGALAETGLTAADRSRLARVADLEERRTALAARGIVVSPEVLRQAVRRDLEMLFGTQRYDTGPGTGPNTGPNTGPGTGLGASPTEHDLSDYPEVRRSVLNYGVPAFAGRTARDFDREGLAREIKAILATFEPRLRESATRVTVTRVERNGGLVIEIDGLLVMTPVPERLRLRTTIDLESGRARTSLGEV